jgi:hypothetical protein
MNVCKLFIALITVSWASFWFQAPCNAATAFEGSGEQTADWEYLTAYGGTGSWQVRKLKATVRREGPSFVIEAYDNRGRVAERITGTLDGNKFNGTRKIMFSEPNDEHIDGTYSQVKDGMRLYEVFSLSNEYWLLGVSRARNTE